MRVYNEMKVRKYAAALLMNDSLVLLVVTFEDLLLFLV